MKARFNLMTIPMPGTCLPAVERQAVHLHLDLLADFLDDLVVLDVAEHFVNQVNDARHVFLDEAAGGDGRSADAEAGGLECAAAVKRNHVLVDGDAGADESLLGHLSGQVGELRTKVDQHQVVVGATGDDVVSLLDECLGEGLGVLLDLDLVVTELRLQSLVEGDGLCGDAVLERTALDAREYGGVDHGTHLLDLALRRGDAPGVVEILADEDDAAARTAEGLVRGGCDDVGILHGVLKQTRGDEAGGMCHVDHEDGAYLVGDCAHALPVPFAGICGCAADDELRLVFESLALHVVIINQAGLLVELIADRVIKLTRHVNRRSVSQVAAVCEVKAHEGVAGLQAGEEYRHVGLGAGVGLDICIFGVKKLAETVDGQLLDLVDHLAAAIVAGPGIAFRVLVGTYAAKGLKHLFAYEVFGSYELDAFALAILFLADQVGNLNVLFHIG